MAPSRRGFLAVSPPPARRLHVRVEGCRSSAHVALAPHRHPRARRRRDPDRGRMADLEEGRAARDGGRGRRGDALGGDRARLDPLVEAAYLAPTMKLEDLK